MTNQEIAEVQEANRLEIIRRNHARELFEHNEANHQEEVGDKFAREDEEARDSAFIAKHEEQYTV